MSFISMDVESDGELPGTYSMVCFGAVVIESTLTRTFYGKVRPISDSYNKDALKISGFTRKQHLKFEDPFVVMGNFRDWLNENSKGKPIFISDNPAYDFQWINHYFYMYIHENPFGYSARRIRDLYCGLVKDSTKNYEWKRLRKTKHTHNPVDDAMGNAEALLEMQKMGLKIKFE